VGGKTDIWTYLLITAVAVLVWYWAAGETRIERVLTPITIEFAVGDATTWRIEPNEMTVIISAKGSQAAIRSAEAVERIVRDLPAHSGDVTLDVAEIVGSHPEIEGTGISIVSTVPSTVDLSVEEIITTSARVVLDALPGVETEDAPVIDPPQIEIRMPSRLLPADGELTVDAIVDRSKLDGLEPGLPQTLDGIQLRLPEAIASSQAVEVTPASVKISFTIRSQIRRVSPPSPVRVQIAGSPEDDYLIEVEPKLLRNVVVEVPEALAIQIESGDAVVFALVYLKSGEKDPPIDRKQITFFLALRPDGSAVMVKARVGESDAPPEINLKITDRAAE